MIIYTEREHNLPIIPPEFKYGFATSVLGYCAASLLSGQQNCSAENKTRVSVKDLNLFTMSSKLARNMTS